MASSNITVEEIIYKLESLPQFSNLSLSQQLQIISTVHQRICNYDFAKKGAWYKYNTLNNVTFTTVNLDNDWQKILDGDYDENVNAFSIDENVCPLNFDFN